MISNLPLYARRLPSRSVPAHATSRHRVHRFPRALFARSQRLPARQRQPTIVHVSTHRSEIKLSHLTRFQISVHQHEVRHARCQQRLSRASRQRREYPLPPLLKRSTHAVHLRLLRPRAFARFEFVIDRLIFLARESQPPRRRSSSVVALSREARARRDFPSPRAGEQRFARLARRRRVRHDRRLPRAAFARGRSRVVSRARARCVASARSIAFCVQVNARRASASRSSPRARAVFAARGLRRRRLAARPSPRVAVCDARVESSRSAATRGYGAI